MSALELSQARTLVETARADAARYAGPGRAGQERAQPAGRRARANAGLLPEAFDESVTGLAPLPAGPALRGAAAPPGRAGGRASAAGGERQHRRRARGVLPVDHAHGRRRHASDELSGLFDAGTGDLELRAAGRACRSSRAAACGRTSAWPPPIATSRSRSTRGPSRPAFREVADALALTGTLADAARAPGKPPSTRRRGRPPLARPLRGRPRQLPRAARGAADAVPRAAER